MSSTAVQSRIAAFESIAASSVKTPRLPSFPSPSPSPPNLGRKTSLIDLKDWIIDDGLTTNSHGIIQHGRPTRNNTVSPELVLQSKNAPIAPLIQLESPPRPRTGRSPILPVVRAPPLPPRKPSLNSLKSSTSSASLISLPSTNGTVAPRPHADSLSVHTYPPLVIDRHSAPRDISKQSQHAPASSISSFHSVSLSSDTDHDPSTPGSLSNFIATFPMDSSLARNHTHINNNIDQYTEADTISLADSYEEISTTSLASPAADRTISSDWAKIVPRRSPAPPKLPQRPSSASSSASSSVTRYGIKSPPPLPSSSRSNDAAFFRSPQHYNTPPPTVFSTPSTPRRVPPPPPLHVHSPGPVPRSRSSDRSSIQSLSSNYSNSSFLASAQNHTQLLNKIKRPTPVPAAARSRYVSVFNANVIQQRRADKQKEKERVKPPLLTPAEARKTRQAAGWRGLSVDLITGGEDLIPACSEKQGDETEGGLSNVSETIDGSERLEGWIVKAIWRRSKLDWTKLRDIWNECDSRGAGSLDCDGFVKGMWRIDEELGRAARQALEATSRSIHKPPPHRPKAFLS